MIYYLIFDKCTSSIFKFTIEFILIVKEKYTSFEETRKIDLKAIKFPSFFGILINQFSKFVVFFLYFMFAIKTVELAHLLIPKKAKTLPLTA